MYFILKRVILNLEERQNIYPSKRSYVPARTRGVINHRCTNLGRINFVLWLLNLWDISMEILSCQTSGT